MQLVAVFTALFAAITAVQAAPAEVEVEARQIYYCGKQPYKKTDYTCYPYNNNLLCPILNGVVYKPCGKACYDPSNYGCRNGALYQVNVCSGVPFDTNTYVCVGGQLCPKSAPNKCGIACYSTSQYWCDHGILKQNGQR